MPARLLSVLLFIVALAAPIRARAEEGAKPDYAAAKKHFKSGQQALQGERYGEAVVEFRKAYEITKDGLVMGQVAEAFAKAGDFENALAAIKVYRESLAEGERASADALIKDYEKAVQEGRSKHLVLPGEKVEKPEPKPDEGGATAPTPPPEDKPARKGRLWTWITLGAAGALALSALVVGLNAQSRFDELSDSCKPSCATSDVDSVKTRAIAADVLWGTAAAAAVTATILFFVEGRSTRTEKEPGEGGEEETVSKRRFRLTPVVGTGRYGLNAGFQF